MLIIYIIILYIYNNKFSKNKNKNLNFKNHFFKTCFFFHTPKEKNGEKIWGYFLGFVVWHDEHS
jgi:hypothetical protein